MNKIFAVAGLCWMLAVPVWAQDPELPSMDLATPTPEDDAPPVDIAVSDAPPSTVKKIIQTKKQTQDDAKIKKTFQLMSESWNKGRAKALAKYFTSDASLVNAIGKTGWSRDKVEKILAAELKMYKGSTQTYGQFKIIFVLPNLALVDVDRVLTDAEGAELLKSHVYAVVVNRTGSWQARAYREAVFAQPAEKAPAPADPAVK